MNDPIVSDKRKKTKRSKKRKQPLSEAKALALQKARESRQLKCRLSRESKAKEAKERMQMLIMPKLTDKQKLFAIGIAEGKTKYQASIDAGYSPNSAATYCPSLLRNPDVQESIHTLMEKAGLGTDNLFKVHSEMLQATKVISVVTGKDANSQSMDFIDVPDWSARGSGLNMAYKLHGLYADQNLNITAETHEQRMQRLLGHGIVTSPGADDDE